MTPNEKEKFPPIKVPKAEYHIGQRVLVRCDEPEYGPHFEATIYRIDARPLRSPEPEYSVIEDSGLMSDGYTACWFTPIDPTPESNDGELEKLAEDTLRRLEVTYSKLTDMGMTEDYAKLSAFTPPTAQQSKGENEQR